MLNIHTGLRKWSKRNVFDLYLKKINPFGIHEPCINIAKNELLFEKFRMTLNRDKYDIEVRNDDTITRNHATKVQYTGWIMCTQKMSFDI